MRKYVFIAIWLAAVALAIYVRQEHRAARIAEPVVEHTVEKRAKVLTDVYTPPVAKPAPVKRYSELEEKIACTPDALQYCATAIPNGREAIIECIKAHQAVLSSACKRVFSAHEGTRSQKTRRVRRAPRPNLGPVVPDPGFVTRGDIQ